MKNRQSEECKNQRKSDLKAQNRENITNVSSILLRLEMKNMKIVLRLKIL
jgi:hypothetical protein